MHARGGSRTPSVTDGGVGDREMRPVVVVIVVHLGLLDIVGFLSGIWLLAGPWVVPSGAFPASKNRTGKHGAQRNG